MPMRCWYDNKMTIIASLRVLCDQFRWTEVIFLKRSYPVASDGTAGRAIGHRTGLSDNDNRVIACSHTPGWRSRQVAGCVICCCTLAFHPGDSFADESSPESIQVKAEETQLARRLAVRESVESPFEYSLSAGYRRDNLSWSIAGGGVNVASEVSWKDTVIAQLRAAGRVNLGADWLVRGYYATGAVMSGSNQDSDYAGNNRTQEYSRSNNATGGAVEDISIGLGRRFHLFDTGSGTSMYIVPLAGLSIHQQNLTMYDGHQTIPFNADISGLHNSYDAQWKGSWLGMDALLGLGEHIFLNSTVEYHRVSYSADADWNLRSDLAHPVSFKHEANGSGVLVSLGASYRFGRNFLLNASLEQQKWDTYSGYDQTNFSNGATSYFTLNPVSWDSTSFFVGAAYQF
jgi:hypothetical protein